MSRRSRSSFDVRHNLMVPGDYVVLFMTDHDGKPVKVRSTVRARVSNGYLIGGTYGSSFIDDADEDRTWRRATRVVR